MRKLAVLALALAALSRAEAPKMPAPAKEHEFLKQFAGEWETDAEMVMEPGKPPVKSKGTESARMLGGFWLTSEMKGDCMGVTVTGHTTVGYDPKARKYVGTWVCSMSDWLCKYEGSADGKTLTLQCEGPAPKTGKTVKMKDVLELKGKDHKVLTSSILGEDGKWTVFMTMNAKRKK
jgi:hypothetical protein